jgi:hypothetical protein
MDSKHSSTHSNSLVSNTESENQSEKEGFTSRKSSGRWLKTFMVLLILAIIIGGGYYLWTLQNGAKLSLTNSETSI